MATEHARKTLDTLAYLYGEEPGSLVISEATLDLSCRPDEFMAFVPVEVISRTTTNGGTPVPLVVVIDDTLARRLAQAA